MTLIVHLSHAPAPDDLAILQARLDPAVFLTTGPDLPNPPDYHILVAGRPRREELVASPHLRALMIPWSGMPVETREMMATFPRVSDHLSATNAGDGRPNWTAQT